MDAEGWDVSHARTAMRRDEKTREKKTPEKDDEVRVLKEYTMSGGGVEAYQ